MKRSPHKKNQRFLGQSQRFLIGLLIAMSMVHLAFEWKTEEVIIVGDEYEWKGPRTEDDEPVLISLATPPPRPKPKPERNNGQIEIVKEFEKNVEKPEEYKDDSFEEFEFDPDQYGGDEHADLGIENHPKPVNQIEIYPHTANCIGLVDKEMEECSKREIMRLVKDRMNTPDILRDIGSKQGVLMKFTIGKNGLVRDVEILQSTHPALAKEASRALRSLPELNPAMQNGMPVSLSMEVPIVLDFKP